MWKEPKVCFKTFSRAREAKVVVPTPTKVVLLLHSDEDYQG